VATVDVARVAVVKTLDGQWRAISYGANGEKIAWTESYRDVRDAEAAGYTISAGAPVEREA
jgi:uncharacterized protein YegP (UPF0339 family)